MFDVFAPVPSMNNSLAVNMTASSQVSMSAGMGIPMVCFVTLYFCLHLSLETFYVFIFNSAFSNMMAQKKYDWLIF